MEISRKAIVDSRKIGDGKKGSNEMIAAALSSENVESECQESIPRFICDVHLGKLARLLRLLGFDCRYSNDFKREEILKIAAKEKRVILSKDQDLMEKGIISAYKPNSEDPKEQIKEVVEKYSLRGKSIPFSRCMKCNGLLIHISPEDAKERIPSGISRSIKEYLECLGCKRIYWKGSHYEKMKKYVDGLYNAV